MVAQRNLFHFTVTVLMFGVRVASKYDRLEKIIFRKVDTVIDEKYPGSLVIGENGLTGWTISLYCGGGG